ncbi:MAG TPA: DEAD/DEAH box helicase [Anaerolineae bacterium]|nr:DEAD/DEAH box helicase [Anaerolineae bacterium]
MTFEHFPFDPRIAAGIRSAGFSTPTPVQESAIPHVLGGRDVLGIAQTGTGKTAAFVLPILQRLTSGSGRHVRVLVLAPTRELAEQTHQAVGQLGRHMGTRSAAIYGGVGKARQLAALRRGVEVVVACPGRLLDHLGEGDIDLSRVEVLVVDEADRMCDMGFLPDVRRVLRHLPADRQTLFFSATMPDEIRSLADNILHDPVAVQIGPIAPVHTVSHALYPTSSSQKGDLLLALLESTAIGRVLVFTRTKRRARNLAHSLANHGHRASELQGNMTQNRRQQAIDGFRSGRYDILVATDVASRGIDVSDIAFVVNYDMPDTVDAYTHRIGRTGRAERTGQALTLVTQEDASTVRAIEAVLGQRIERRMLDSFPYQAEAARVVAGAGAAARSQASASSGRSWDASGRRRVRPGTAPRRRRAW